MKDFFLLLQARFFKAYMYVSGWRPTYNINNVNLTKQPQALHLRDGEGYN